MRERAVVPKKQAPHGPLEEKVPERSDIDGVDGWMTAVRGFFVLAIGLVLLSLFTTI